MAMRRFLAKRLDLDGGFRPPSICPFHVCGDAEISANGLVFHGFWAHAVRSADASQAPRMGCIRYCVGSLVSLPVWSPKRIFLAAKSYDRVHSGNQKTALTESVQLTCTLENDVSMVVDFKTLGSSARG